MACGSTPSRKPCFPNPGRSPTLLVFLAGLSAVSASSNRPCTAQECQYLGKGYNILIGDPHAHGSDPGWSNDVISPSWVVANGEANDVNICTFESETSTISGGRSAQSSYKKDKKMSGSVGIWVAKVAFTASDSVNDMNKSSWHEEKHFEDARAACELMYAQLPPPYQRYNFTDSFAASVANLPNESSPAADEMLASWMGFFGTHYSFGVTMGGQMVLRWTMSSTSYSNLTQHLASEGKTVEAGVKGSFWMFADPEGKVEKQIDTEATAAFEQATEGQERSELYIGGAPFVKGDPAAWYSGLKDNLASVYGAHNELRPLTDLLTPTNFPQLAARIDSIRKVGEEFIARLCSSAGSNLGYEACTPFPTDPLLVPDRTIPTGSPIFAVAWARDGGNVTTGDGRNLAVAALHVRHLLMSPANTRKHHWTSRSYLGNPNSHFT